MTLADVVNTSREQVGDQAAVVVEAVLQNFKAKKGEQRLKELVDDAKIEGGILSTIAPSLSGKVATL
jgi:hypothetical protein